MTELHVLYITQFPRDQAGWGYDFRRNMSVAWGDYGSYATDIFTQEAAQAGATSPRPKTGS
jgi:hypothetical protein